MVATRSTSSSSKRTLLEAFQPRKNNLNTSARSREALKATTTPSSRMLTEAARTTKSRKKQQAGALPKEPPLPTLSCAEVNLCTTTMMSSLPFDLEAAKSHLVKADVRFIPLLERIPLRVFEEIEQGTKEVNLFKTLVTSIIGQQVSWLAARAILHKFTRLYFPELPASSDFATLPRDSLPFPTPLQVRASTEAQLRSAGLSGQKIRYVRDVAERFSDGRLDIRRIFRMREAEILEELCKIKGIGVWTAQMLLIFALRRPDVLPVGDLGVQRGMVLLWASGSEGPVIESAKARPLKGEAIGTQRSDKTEEGGQTRGKAKIATEGTPKIEEAVLEAEQDKDMIVTGAETANCNGFRAGEKLASELRVPALPVTSGLTTSTLRARKNGTKIKGNVYLNTAEMDALAQTWSPYRSLASVLMWALVDA